MKKLLKIGIIGFVALVVIIVVVLGLTLDSAVKKGVETVGPMVIKVPVKMDSAKISIVSGGGSINGFVIGNPEGFKSPSAISVGHSSVSVSLGSVLSDKIVVKSVVVNAPEITFETDLKRNNLNQILKNMDETMGGRDTNAAPKDAAKASRKLQVDEFILTGGKINVSVTALGGKSMTVPLPDISFKDLGTGPDGITAADLTRKVLNEIIQKAIPAATAAVSDLGKQAAGLVGGLGKSGGDTVGKSTKGLTDLFKKKPATNAPAK
jgi:hypothetical protein